MRLARTLRPGGYMVRRKIGMFGLVALAIDLSACCMSFSWVQRDSRIVQTRPDCIELVGRG